MGSRRGVLRVDRRLAGVAEHHQIGKPPLLRRAQSVLVLPLGSGDRRAAVGAAVLAQRRRLRQRRAEPRPQDEDDHVEGARRFDRILEMSRRQHRLVLPEIRLDREEAAVVLRQLVDDETGAQTLHLNVAGRRDEHSDALGHRHSQFTERRRFENSLRSRPWGFYREWSGFQKRRMAGGRISPVGAHRPIPSVERSSSRSQTVRRSRG